MFLRKILVPVDFSSRSVRALAYAVRLSRTLGAEVFVLHVLTPPSVARLAFDAYSGRPLPEVDASERLHAQDQLTSLLSSVDHTGIVVHKRVAVGDPAATIVCNVSEEPFDLVVMGTHGRTGVADFVAGSVTRALIASAPCPVLSLGPEELSAR